MTTAKDAIEIKGLKEFQRALKLTEAGSQKELRLVLNKAADLVVQRARPMVPRLTGKAAASLKAQSTQREARVKAGGAKVPYFPWLDFGGKVGINKSVNRPFFKEGRYMYPAYRDRRATIQAELEQGLTDLADRSGLI